MKRKEGCTMKKLRRVSGILLALFMLMSLYTTAFAKSQFIEGEQVYALNSFSGQQMKNVENVQRSDRQVSFGYAGNKFVFSINPVSIDTTDGNNISGAKYYSGKSGNLICNMVEYEDSYCIQVFDSSKSILGRQNDPKNNFTIIGGKQMDNKINIISSTLASENDKNMKAARAGLHVYVSGLSIPFLISGGSAEGWCNATIRENNNYQVSSLSYVIAYNWPSDGISLWYDYQNSVNAYSSPAWPSSQYTTVSGSWTINGSSGAFMAEATVSALVQGVPLMWSLYDVSYMNGTHQ